jgi:MFS family permease
VLFGVNLAQYNVSDIPSNLLLKHFGSNWLAFLVLSFGLVSIFSAFVTSYAGLIVTRVFLGLAEGGTLSALVYIMARVSLFLSCLSPR